MEDEVHTSSLDETGSAAYDVSDDGILAFAPPATGAREVRLSWRDGMGNEEPLPFEKRRFTLMRLSPDEKTIAVQIDDVQPLEAVGAEAPGLLRRVGVEHGRPVHVALFETHALPILQVNGGEQDHGFHLRKLAIRASPSR